MSKKGIFIIMLFLSSICFAQKPKSDQSGVPDLNNLNSYSGVYEGLLGYAMCCDSYDTATAWIAIDMESSPPVILYDGVFYTHLVVKGSQLVDNSKYSDYPNKILGAFDQNKELFGLWYNNLGVYEGNSEYKKVFLKKTGNSDNAKELIAKYRAEEERWNSFWTGIKADIDNLNWSSIASSVYYPIEDNTSYAMDNNTPRILNTAKEFVKRLEKAHKTGTLKPFGENRMEAFRTEDHYPGMPSMYMLDLMTGTFLFTEINGEFKIVQMFGPAG